MKARLGLIAGPALVVIAVIVTLFTLLGGPEENGRAATTVPPDPVEAGALLIVEQSGSVPVVLTLQPRDAGGLALAMSGLTLFKTADGFQTLSELHQGGQDEALSGSLDEALGIQTGVIASAQWSDLRSAMEAVQLGDLPPVVLTSDRGEVARVASALLELLKVSAAVGGSPAWMEVPLGGEADGFRAALQGFVSSISAEEWSAAEITGRLVESTGFVYLEPDIESAKALLMGTAQEQSVTLQIQNGSGAVGIAEEAGELLEPLGYVMLPPGNSEDFPNVRQTRIMVSPDAVYAGNRIRTALGVGVVIEDDTLETRNVIVVLGEDYTPPVTDDVLPNG